MKITFKHEIKTEDKITKTSVINEILKNRDIENIDEFLNPVHPTKINLTDFGAFSNNLKKVLNLLYKIRKENGMIVVYTDYDADGITGGAILWETLNFMGFKVMPYVPHRKLEGYGFSKKGIDAVKKLYHPSLIISVDHGITAWDKVEYAKSLGIPVIITDHHLKPDKLPDKALAIFHIPELSGSGVSYFFSKAIFEYFLKLNLTGSVNVVNEKTDPVKTDWQILKNNFSSDYLSLASIGTIADLVPLIGPSRSIVKFGLESFKNSKRKGIKQLLKEAGIADKKITTYDVGFIIAPRINAVGRLEHAIDALRLLCTTNDKKAFDLASKVGGKNRERQDLVEKAVEEAKKMVDSQSAKLKSKLIILFNDSWHEGIIGLIASKIAEKYYRPTIVLTKSDGFLKGSARSIPNFHITNFLRDNKNFLIDVGGHKQAAGFTMEKKKFAAFKTAAFKKINKILKEKDMEKIITADLKIPISKVNISLAQAIETLQPFGIGNPQPVLLSDVELLDKRSFGKTNKHLKFYVREPDTRSYPLELISFNTGDQFNDLLIGQKIRVVYSLEINRWNGNENIRGKLINYS